jgi:ABC-2 type transport system ATP-binding protein
LGKEHIISNDNPTIWVDTMEPAIETRALTKKFGSFVALDNLNIRVEKKHAVGFLGPNGAGKTTTIKILTRFIRATSGEAFIDGMSVKKHPKESISNVGTIVETPEFYPYLTPTEMLDYVGRLRGLSSQDIKDNTKRVLETTKMNEWADKKIGKFSKGMKQRVALAQALLHSPELLILDEPTSGLDPRGMAEVRDIILNVKKEGRTIFMSSHLLNEVQEVCDKVAIIDHGKMVVYEDVESLSKKVISEGIEVTCLKEITQALADSFREIPGVKVVELLSPHKFTLGFSNDENEKAKLLNALQAKGIEVTSFKSSGIALENIYLQLIKDSR